MKQIAIMLISILALSACGRESSPDGRSRIRDEKIQLQLDSLKQQQQALQDSLVVIENRLDKMGR